MTQLFVGVVGVQNSANSLLFTFFSINKVKYFDLIFLAGA